MMRPRFTQAFSPTVYGRVVSGHAPGFKVKVLQTLENVALNVSRTTGVSKSGRSQLQIPANRMWHPAKCEADQGLGASALEWSKLVWKAKAQ